MEFRYLDLFYFTMVHLNSMYWLACIVLTLKPCRQLFASVKQKDNK